MTVAALVLAAGASRRLGEPKQLVSIDGVPLVRRIVERAMAACDAVCVVLGARPERVAGALVGLDVALTFCPLWFEGMGASLRTGVAWARAAGHDAVMVLTCDQPRLTVEHARSLVDHHHSHARATVASRYADTLGVPAVFGSAQFDALLALEGDRGARALLRSGGNVIAVDWADGAFDIDTPADIARLFGHSAG
ncbi:MAG TPA: nucleotidyltransferase family protein [Kofleriaceae bacterium]